MTSDASEGAGWANRDLKPRGTADEDPREPTKDGLASRSDDDARGFSASQDPKDAEPSDAVELALAKALEAATQEGRWDVVAQLAREFEA